jgi:hypothetical protein
MDIKLAETVSESAGSSLESEIKLASSLNKLDGAGEKRNGNMLYSDVTGGIASKLVTIVNENLNNKQKSEILNEIIQNEGFSIVSKNDEKDSATKVFETVRKTDAEYADNLNAARSLNNIGYGVYILPKVPGSKSFDYILTRGNKVYAAELKTIYGSNSLNNRLNAANEQSNRFVLNIVGNATSRYVADEIKGFYLRNPHIKEVIVLKGGKPIYVKYEHVTRKTFVKTFMDMWAR